MKANVCEYKPQQNVSANIPIFTTCKMLIIVLVRHIYKSTMYSKDLLGKNNKENIV
jgi:hypothetical protein